MIGVLIAAIAVGSVSASSQVRVGLLVSATGPTSAIGIPQKNTGALLPARVGDTAVEYISLEDGGDATENWLRAERELVTA